MHQFCFSFSNINDVVLHVSVLSNFDLVFCVSVQFCCSCSLMFTSFPFPVSFVSPSCFVFVSKEFYDRF